MNRYTYTVVPFIGQINRKQKAIHVSEQLQEVINEQAKRGLEFHSLGEVSIAINQGCLAGLLGRGTEYAKFDQLVFRRQISSDE